MVSMVPTFEKPNPQEEIEIVENERPEEEIIISDEKFLFIFLVDQSGSMKGKKMEMAKEALLLFL